MSNKQPDAAREVEVASSKFFDVPSTGNSIAPSRDTLATLFSIISNERSSALADSSPAASTKELDPNGQHANLSSPLSKGKTWKDATPRELFSIVSPVVVTLLAWLPIDIHML
jgi:hypothetical protein